MANDQQNQSPVSLPVKSWPARAKRGLGKYWNDPDKFIALSVAGSGVIVASFFGSVILSLGIGLTLATYLSYKRSCGDIYTGSRLMVHDLSNYPKYIKDASKLVGSSPTENSSNTSMVLHKLEQSPNQHLPDLQSFFDTSVWKITFDQTVGFPLHLVLLSKSLDPNNVTKSTVVGYACVELLPHIYGDEKLREIERCVSTSQDPASVLQTLVSNGLHPDVFKRDRKDLYAYCFGTVCLLRTVVVREDFRGNGLGSVLVAYALQKLKDLCTIDILLCKRDAFIEHVMDKFHGRYYTPPEYARKAKNHSVHPALRTETIFFPVYKKKMRTAVDDALEKFFMFEKLKKATVPYFVKENGPTRTDTVAIRAPSPVV